MCMHTHASVCAQLCVCACIHMHVFARTHTYTLCVHVRLCKPLCMLTMQLVSTCSCKLTCYKGQCGRVPAIRTQS
jgi:hypothetical protein